MIRKRGERRTLAQAVARACMGASAHAALVLPAFAQSDADAPPQRGRDIEEIVVEDRADDLGYRTDSASLTKLTEPLRDVPQSIVTVPRELLEDRGATSLNDALRTVPGITLGAGEFSWQGNNPNLRGFSSRNDMFLDGMRDFGSYPRDPFNLESIEVLQGPSSMIFGRGSTGGVINQVSKRPTLDSLTSVSFNGGNDETMRATTDIARALPMLGSGAAFRVNAMAHQAEVAGRDVAETQRYAVAPSLALGLDGPTRLTLSYLHQTTDDVPDYGLPWFNGRPADVRRDNFYGFESDYLETEAGILSADVAHAASDSLTLHGLIRNARYERESRLTEPLIAATVPPATPLEQITVTRNVFTGRSVEQITQAQGDATLHFGSGGAVEHAFVAGFEAARESSAPSFGFGVNVPGTNLVTPTPGEPFSATSTLPRLISDTDADSLGFYALDTLKLGEQWQVVLGARWDRFDADYRATRFAANGTSTGTERIERVDEEWSYRAGLVYKPRDNGSVYLGWGTSFNPSAETLSFITSGRALGIGNAFLAPEENDSVEVGTKWDVLDESLSVNAAVFRITKDNARVPDPNNAGFNMLAGEQRVDGFSITLAGRVGMWQLTSGYTHLDSEQRRSAAGAAPAGSELANAPEHTFTSWASYAISSRFDVGAGARYVSDQLAQNVPPVKSVDSYWALDAMGKYRVSNTLTLKLNLTNLTDEYYLDQLHPFHVVPGAGLTAVLAVNAVF